MGSVWFDLCVCVFFFFSSFLHMFRLFFVTRMFCLFVDYVNVTHLFMFSRSKFHLIQKREYWSCFVFLSVSLSLFPFALHCRCSAMLKLDYSGKEIAWWVRCGAVQCDAWISLMQIWLLSTKSVSVMNFINMLWAYTGYKQA